MIENGLLQVLCCPETHQALSLAADTVCEALNLQIKRGTLRNRGGLQLSECMEGGLIRADGKYLYPIRHGIPIMLVEEAIPLAAI